MNELTPITGKQLLDDMEADLEDLFSDESEDMEETEIRYGILATPESFDPRNRNRKFD